MGDPSLSEELRARGLRLTPQRQLVLEAVIELEHSTPEQISAKVRRTAAGVNITTVYRTLELLEELGLVRHTHLGHGPPTYHSAEDQHLHTVCHRCGRVQSVSPGVLDDVVRRLAVDAGFQVDVGHVALSGLCRDCGRSAGAESAGAAVTGTT